MQENIKVEQLNETECSISINLSAEIVDKKFNDFFEGIKSKAQIPGWRKGHAPASILKQYLGEKAKAPVAGTLVSEFYQKAVRDQGLNPIGSPNIKNFNSASEYPGKFGFDNSYSVELTIEVLPKVDPKGYDGLELKMEDVDVSDIYNHRMHEYQEQFAERTQVTDQGANLNDTLVIDFVGYIDDKTFDGGAAKDYTLDKLGEGRFIPGFEEQLLGMKPGESKKIYVTFPENYHAQHLANKNATFDVTVHSIVHSKLAEVNNDLAMMAGFTTVEELQKKVSEDSEKEKKSILRQKMDHQIISKLLSLNEFKAPKTLIEQEYKHLMSRIKGDNLPEEFVNEIRKNAEFNVKRAIITNAIYEKESSVEVTPEELNEMLEEHAKMNNKTKDELVSALYNANQMDNFVGVLRFAKVIDFIINHSKTQESEAEVCQTQSNNQ